MEKPRIRLAVYGGPHDGSFASVARHHLATGTEVTVGKTVYHVATARGGGPRLVYKESK